MRHRRPAARRRTLLIITILAIMGTLSACGRYGSPVRLDPTASGVDESGAAEAMPTDESPGEPAEAGAGNEDEDDESSGESGGTQ